MACRLADHTSDSDFFVGFAGPPALAFWPCQGRLGLVDVSQTPIGTSFWEVRPAALRAARKGGGNVIQRLTEKEEEELAEKKANLPFAVHWRTDAPAVLVVLGRYDRATF